MHRAPHPRCPVEARGEVRPRLHGSADSASVFGLTGCAEAGDHRSSHGATIVRLETPATDAMLGVSQTYLSYPDGVEFASHQIDWNRTVVDVRVLEVLAAALRGLLKK